MGILVVMLFVSLLLAFGFLWAFLWASRNKQFEDLTSPAWRAVFDEGQRTTSIDLAKKEEVPPNEQQ